MAILYQWVINYSIKIPVETLNNPGFCSTILLSMANITYACNGGNKLQLEMLIAILILWLITKVSAF